MLEKFKQYCAKVIAEQVKQSSDEDMTRLEKAGFVKEDGMSYALIDDSATDPELADRLEVTITGTGEYQASLNTALQCSGNEFFFDSTYSINEFKDEVLNKLKEYLSSDDIKKDEEIAKQYEMDEDPELDEKEFSVSIETAKAFIKKAINSVSKI